MMGPLDCHRVENPHPGGVPRVHGALSPPLSEQNGLMAVRRPNCAATQNSLSREKQEPCVQGPHRFLAPDNHHFGRFAQLPQTVLDFVLIALRQWLEAM